jgi:ABC-2 type transport system ATP-binding protein
MGRGWTGFGTRILAVVCAAALVVAVAACSGSDSGSGSGSGSGGGSPSAAAEAGGQPCDRRLAPPPRAARVRDVPSDRDITSFDGTRIRAHWFPVRSATADDPAPTVLMGPGWGQGGDTNVGGGNPVGGVNIGQLRRHGFNVMTWDPRGFGASAGTVEVDSADAEGRDVQVLLDWIAARRAVQLDRRGDPRVGMVGASYGGGIQLVTAAIDCRVDALVPIIAWHSLRTSLYKADTPKMGWANLLSTAAQGRHVDRHITRASQAMNERGVLNPADVSWFADRGPGDLVDDIAVPTLLIQGTVDTLFTLDEAIANYRTLRENGVPVHMLWYCGGHGACLTRGGNPRRVTQASLAWLERYVKGDRSVDVGPQFEFVDQDGHRYTADDYPLPTGTPLTARGSGRLRLVADGGAGPVTDPPPARGPDPLRSIVLPVTPAEARNAVDVAVPAPDDPVLVVGPPRLSLEYRGTARRGARPTRVFAQLVDRATGLAVGNQVTPIEVTLDGESHTAEVPLEVVAYAMTPSSRLSLQVVATTVAYAPPRLGGSVTFDEIGVSLPVAADLAPGER